MQFCVFFDSPFHFSFNLLLLLLFFYLSHPCIFFLSRTAADAREPRFNVEWLLRDLTTIDRFDLSFNNKFSSSAASALVSPVCVLMSPCMMPNNCAWCRSSANCSFLPAHFTSCRFVFSSLSSRLHLTSLLPTSSLYDVSCDFNSCFIDTHHHCLPVSLLSILVRHRRRRRLLFLLPFLFIHYPHL